MRSTPVRRGPGPHARPILAALVIAVTSRAALAGVVWFALRVLPRHAPYPVQLPDTFFPDHPALDGWARWDAAHYVAIAQVGYGADNPSPHGGVGFFPLYPLLMRGLVEAVGATPTSAHLALAGIAISNLCFLVAVALLARLGAARFGERTVADGRRWWLAGVAAGLASGTRLVGLALAPALLLAAYRRGAKLPQLIATGALSISGTVAYFAYCAWRFNDLFAYFSAQSEWGGWDQHVRFYAELFFTHPRQALNGRPEDLIVALDLAIGLIFFAFIPRLWRMGVPAVALLSTLLVVVQGGFTWLSLGRYVLPAVGVYLAVALWLAGPRWSSWVRDALVVLSALLMGFLAVLYATGFWVV
jgi:hypothetical protein